MSDFLILSRVSEQYEGKCLQKTQLSILVTVSLQRYTDMEATKVNPVTELTIADGTIIIVCTSWQKCHMNEKRNLEIINKNVRHLVLGVDVLKVIIWLIERGHIATYKVWVTREVVWNLDQYGKKLVTTSTSHWNCGFSRYLNRHFYLRRVIWL